MEINFHFGEGEAQSGQIGMKPSNQNAVISLQRGIMELFPFVQDFLRASRHETQIQEFQDTF